MAATKSSERRDGPRIDLRLRVRYEAAEAGSEAVGGEAEASDVSPKGLRIESDKPVEKGTILKLHVDAGEAEELECVGQVTWCRPRPSPTGKTLYDLGVAFESDWLARDRGPLGSALARIFAMNSYEPARNFERTPVSLKATSTQGDTAASAIELEVGNVSIGGMQIRSKTPLGELKAGIGVVVDIEADGGTSSLRGKVAWVAGARGDSARLADSFGIEFGEITQEDRGLLEKIRTGQTEPVRITVALEG
jgi:hypothetical protein